MQKTTIENQINELKKITFQYQQKEFGQEKIFINFFLRQALLCWHKIQDVSEEDEIELLEKLDEIVENKVKKIVPTIDNQLLKDILVAYKRPKTIYPLDIFIVDDAVFQQEIEHRLNGKLQKKTLLVSTNYYNIKDYVRFWTEDISKYPFGEDWRSKNQEKYLSEFICDKINETVKNSYGKSVLKPDYYIDDQKFFIFGITGIDQEHINVYLNKKLGDIGGNIQKNHPLTIKMIIQNEEEFNCYLIHQYCIKNFLKWDITKEEKAVLKLSEEGKNKNTKVLSYIHK